MGVINPFWWVHNDSLAIATVPTCPTTTSPTEQPAVLVTESVTEQPPVSQPKLPLSVLDQPNSVQTRRKLFEWVSHPKVEACGRSTSFGVFHMVVIFITYPLILLLASSLSLNLYFAWIQLVYIFVVSCVLSLCVAAGGWFFMENFTYILLNYKYYVNVLINFKITFMSF